MVAPPGQGERTGGRTDRQYHFFTKASMVGWTTKAIGKKVQYRPQDMKQFEADFGATRAEFFEYLNNG